MVDFCIPHLGLIIKVRSVVLAWAASSGTERLWHMACLVVTLSMKPVS